MNDIIKKAISKAILSNELSVVANNNIIPVLNLDLVRNIFVVVRHKVKRKYKTKLKTIFDYESS